MSALFPARRPRARWGSRAQCHRVLDGKRKLLDAATGEAATLATSLRQAEEGAAALCAQEDLHIEGGKQADAAAAARRRRLERAEAAARRLTELQRDFARRSLPRLAEGAASESDGVSEAAELGDAADANDPDAAPEAETGGEAGAKDAADGDDAAGGPGIMASDHGDR